ncbi:MAG: sigma-70 family RNA polymerase sigma factor [Flavobacteriales bacterium]|nr:sigma-70 family RNA polymerase sigma factor [Flavobacteriales bacterium]
MHGQMMSICSRYERNKQDAVARMNQGFLKILTNIDKRRPEVPFELWARRIMINTVIDEYRKDRPRKAQESWMPRWTRAPWWR